MSGVINKIKDAIVGEPAENPRIASTASGADNDPSYSGGTTGPHTSNTANRLDPSVDSSYDSTNRTGLGGNNTSSYGNTGSGVSSGVESTRITNMGHIGQVDRDSTSGVGQGFPGVTGHTGSSDKYGEGIESRSAAPGVAGMKHHQGRGEEFAATPGGGNTGTGAGVTGHGYGSGNTGGGYGAGNTGTGIVGEGVGATHGRDEYGSNTTSSGITGSGNTGGGYGSNTTGITGAGSTGAPHAHGHRGVEAGAIGAGIAGAEHERSHHGHHGHHSNTGMGTTGTGGSNLSREEIASRIEPHQNATGGNFDQYTSPSVFSHGKHHGLGGGEGGLTSGSTNTGGEYGSNTTGAGGVTGQGIGSGEYGSTTGHGLGSGTGRGIGGNDYAPTGRNDRYDDQTGSTGLGSGRNDEYDNQRGSNVGTGSTAPHSSNLLNKLDPRVDTTQSGRNV